MTMRILLMLTLLFLAGLSNASIDLKQFDTPQQEADYRELIFELRCLVCQNQNLADSNAELAVDLRRQTYEMISSGKSKQDVVDYMVERYGEFVLYRPPFNLSTLFLWVGPFIFLGASIAILLKLIRGRKQEAPIHLDESEKEKMRSLLNDSQEKP